MSVLSTSSHLTLLVLFIRPCFREDLWDIFFEILIFPATSFEFYRMNQEVLFCQVRYMDGSLGPSKLGDFHCPEISALSRNYAPRCHLSLRQGIRTIKCCWPSGTFGVSSREICQIVEVWRWQWPQWERREVLWVEVCAFCLLNTCSVGVHVCVCMCWVCAVCAIWPRREASARSIMNKHSPRLPPALSPSKECCTGITGVSGTKIVWEALPLVGTFGNNLKASCCEFVLRSRAHDFCEMHSMWLTGLSKLNEVVCSVLEPNPMQCLLVCEYKLKVVIKQVYIRIRFVIVRDMQRQSCSAVRLKISKRRTDNSLTWIQTVEIIQTSDDKLTFYGLFQRLDLFYLQLSSWGMLSQLLYIGVPRWDE